MRIGEVLRIPKDDIKNLALVAKLVKTKYAEKSVQTDSDEVAEVIHQSHPCDTFIYDPARDTFRVALMLPFYLYENDTIELYDSLRFEELLKEFFADDEIDKANFPSKPGLNIFESSKVFLEFYEGFLLAVDTMKKTGINLQLYVFNTQNSQDTVMAILQQPELKTMDLIVGPVFNRKLELVANFAGANKIPFVSPLLSTDTTSINNPYFFQVIPSLETQIDKFTDVISNYYAQNVVLMHYGTEEEKTVVDLYKKYLLPKMEERADADTVRFNVVQLDHEKAFDIIKPRKDEDDKEVIDHPIKAALNDSIPNLVIIPAKDRSLISNTIRQLNTIYEEVVSDYEITICGFPNVQRFENIDLEYLHNLDFHTFLSSYIDYQSYPVKKFILNYRTNFKAEPSQFAFQAYDIGLYFISMLKEKGSGFQNCLQDFPQDSITELQNEFDFVLNPTIGGYENQHIYVLKYDHEYDIVRLDLLFKALQKEKQRKIMNPDTGTLKEKPKDKESLRLYHPPE